MRETCQQLLRNDALRRALTELEKSYMVELVTSAPEETTLREQMYHKINAGRELLLMVENYGR
jgi:hypothetical protein